MGNAVTLGLAAFCAVMTGIVAVEWVNPPRLKGGSANSQSTQGARDLEVKPVESFAIAPLSRYDEIIARPLFSGQPPSCRGIGHGRPAKTR